MDVAAALTHLARSAGAAADEAADLAAGWAATYTVRTGSGGAHLYYAAPAGVRLGNTAGTLAPHVDTRAHGGYAVAASSTVAGRHYLLLDGRDPAPLPPALLQPLTRPTSPAGPSPRRPVPVQLAAYLHAALTREAARVTSAPVGSRNHRLYLAAVALGQLAAGGALPAELVRACCNRPGRTGLAAGEIGPTITSGLRAGARRPRRLAA